MNSKRLFLVDGMSHIYRAYYAIRGLSTSKGLPTNAIYGFTSMLRKLIQDERPDYLGVAIDLEGPTVRHEKFESYKATRKPMPEDLAQQIPYILRVCEAFRVPVLAHASYEADDVIGTLAQKGTEQGLVVMVVTSDKDMLQLVSDRIRVLDPMKDNLILDPQKVMEKFGVEPRQVPDLLGLWGDTVDNIPGAPGIGEKGARELIQKYGTLEECLRNWDKVSRKTYQKSLRDNADLIRMSLELATISRDLPVDLDLEALALSEPDPKAAFDLFAELEFKALMREFLQEEKREPLKGEWLSGKNALDFLSSLKGQPRIFFVLGLQDAGFNRKAVASAGVQGESGDAAIFDLKDASIGGAWAKLMADPALNKICWDAKLCLLSQEPRRIHLGANVDDVMLQAFLTEPHIGEYTLKRWALDQLHLSLPDEKNDAQNSLPGSEETAGDMCRKLEAVRRLHELLAPKLAALEVEQVYRNIELPLFPVLSDMERTGVKIDRAMLNKMSSVMEQQLEELTRRIHEAAGTEFNINSTKQLGEILFEKLNLPSVKKTRKTRGYSTDQAVLEELAETYELPKLILEYRQVSKLKSTYVDALPLLINPSTGRVHTSFNQTGAATGRLSSSDPNLQNIPIRSELGRLIRGAFVPEEGNLLISADYSQVELRVLAHLSEDEVLTDAFRRGEDIHDRTAREVFSPEQLENRIECRRMAKVINFGIVYGLSAFGLAQRLGIPREQAQAFIDAYFQRYKGVRAWLDRTVEDVRRTGLARTLFGRIRPIPDIHSREYTTRQFAERTAVNSPIQGTAADIIKLAMINLDRALRKRALSAKILLQVHDELVVEAPRDEASDVQAIIREEMEHAASLRVPLRVELNVADNWMDMK